MGIAVPNHYSVNLCSVENGFPGNGKNADSDNCRETVPTRWREMSFYPGLIILTKKHIEEWKVSEVNSRNGKVRTISTDHSL